jgi:hydroxyacylglutathione hydrolase
MTIKVTIVETPGLGDRSYLVSDGSLAAVIDPQRDIDRFLSEVDRLGVTLTDVVETHIHNDYVTGGPELAGRSGARYWVAAADEVGFERRPVADGDRIEVGSFALVALHTPGHTPNHLSYALEEGGRVTAVFTGGSLLYGTVGRTDLIAPDRTEELTRAQRRSAQLLVGELPEEAAVHPTHGFGSFCSSASGSGKDASTIGEEARSNLALTTGDEDAFVKALLGGLVAYPRYYAHMAPINRKGPPPSPLGLQPRRIGAAELAERIGAGEWAVDLRPRGSYCASHLPGTVSVELSDPFATYLGWTIRWGTPLILMAPSEHQVAEARRQLVRIGMDDLEGAAVGALEELTGEGEAASYPAVSFVDLAKATSDGDELLVLDVRRPDEWEAGHLPGALHIPFYDLEDRMAEVPDDQEVWVHCASGFRASIGASLIDRVGKRAVLIDDDWDQAAQVGLNIVTP